MGLERWLCGYRFFLLFQRVLFLALMFQRLPTACKSSSQGSNTLCWRPSHLHMCGIYIWRTYTKNKSLIKKEMCPYHNMLPCFNFSESLCLLKICLRSCSVWSCDALFHCTLRLHHVSSFNSEEMRSLDTCYCDVRSHRDWHSAVVEKPASNELDLSPHLQLKVKSD